MSSNQTVAVDPHKLASLVRSLFRQARLNEEHAGLVAQNLCQAEMRGVYSHGVSKVKPYIHSIENGTYNPYPVISVLRESGATALLDGDFAPGAVSGTAAMELCLNKAAESGFACTTVTRGRHFGMAAFWVMRLPEACTILPRMETATPAEWAFSSAPWMWAGSSLLGTLPGRWIALLMR